MRNREIISIIACILAMGYGCTNDVPLTSQSQAIIYDNIGIGEGVDTRYSDKGTGESCVIDTKTKFTDQPLYSSRMSSFYSNDTSTLYREIKANLGAEFGVKEISQPRWITVSNLYKIIIKVRSC